MRTVSTDSYIIDGSTPASTMDKPNRLCVARFENAMQLGHIFFKFFVSESMVKDTMTIGVFEGTPSIDRSMVGRLTISAHWVFALYLTTLVGAPSGYHSSG